MSRGRRHWLSLRAASLHSADYAVEADDPARNRFGCFLPDLTRLATTPSADFRARIWCKAPHRASSCFPSSMVHASKPTSHDAEVETA